MVLTLSNLIRLLQKSCTRSISSRAIRPEVKSAKRSYSQNNVSSYNHARTRSAVTGATQCLQKPRVTCRSRTSSWVGSIQKDYHHGQKQAFSASNFRAARKWRPIEQLRMRHFLGPFSWKAGAIFIFTGACMIVYFRHEKARMERKQVAKATKGVGRPKVGGDFHLMDQNGRSFSSEDMKGKYSLVYFGFTHCPDICPEELDKMAIMIDLVKEKCEDNVLLPIFITCDPARDTPAVMKTYLREFHEDFIGLTGTWQQIKEICKAYRVYFSTPPDVKPGQDYLVDHSIYFYLMDPEGDFIEALGRNFSPQQAAKIISDHIGDKEETMTPVQQGHAST